jgi:DNA modification methylase
MTDPDMIDRIRQVIEAALSDAFDMDISLNSSAPASITEPFLASTARFITERTIRAAFDPADNEHDPLNEMHPRNRLNDMTGAAWLWFTKSVLRTSYPSILGHDLRKAQGGNKPPQLMCELIEFFTKEGDTVLDPFGGAGGTALGAYLAGRKSLSIELNPESIALYHAVCQQENIEPHPFIQGDCREILPTLEANRFDFIATDPPYSPELQQTMSGSGASDLYGRANRRSSYITYSDDPRDLSKSGSFEAFFAALDDVGRELLRVVKPRRYLALILRDAYQNREYIHTSAIVAQRYRALGWKFKGEKIWYNTGTRIRPYGYPSAFVPNIIHQNILIFRKE